MLASRRSNEEGRDSRCNGDDRATKERGSNSVSHSRSGIGASQRGI